MSSNITVDGFSLEGLLAAFDVRLQQLEDAVAAVGLLVLLDHAAEPEPEPEPEALPEPTRIATYNAQRLGWDTAYRAEVRRTLEGDRNLRVRFAYPEHGDGEGIEREVKPRAISARGMTGLDALRNDEYRAFLWDRVTTSLAVYEYPEEES